MSGYFPFSAVKTEPLFIIFAIIKRNERTTSLFRKSIRLNILLLDKIPFTCYDDYSIIIIKEIIMNSKMLGFIVAFGMGLAVIGLYELVYIQNRNQKKFQTDCLNMLEDFKEESSDNRHEYDILNNALIKKLDKVSTKFDKTVDELAKFRTEIAPLVNAECEMTPVQAALRISTLTDPILRYKSVDIMARLGGKECTDRLRHLAENDPDKSVNAKALEELADMDTVSASKIARIHLKTKYGTARQGAAKILSKIANKDMVPFILDVLDSISIKDRDESYTFRYLFQTLEKLQLPETCKPISRILLKGDFSSWEYGFKALVESSTEKEICYILEILEKKPSNELKPGYLDYYILRDLGKFKDPRMTKFFITQLSSTSSSTRRYTAEALIAVQDPLAAQPLLNAYEKETYSRNKKIYESAFSEGFPGIVLNQDTKKFTLVPEIEMTKLLKKRKALIEKLNKKKAEK